MYQFLIIAYLFTSNEQGHEKMCLMPYANNKGIDQPVHPRSLISAFVVRCQDNDTSSLYIRNYNFSTLREYSGEMLSLRTCKYKTGRTGFVLISDYWSGEKGI